MSQVQLTPEMQARNKRLRTALLAIAMFLVIGTILYVSWYGSL